MKYYFTVGTVFKNESWGMREWIEHYKAHGADHIYMVDDGSTDDYLSILQPYIDDGYVTLYYNDINVYTGRQVEINNRYFLPILKDTRWFSNLDMDEYLYSPVEFDIKASLTHFEQFDYLEVNWAYFTSNGYVNQPDGIVESFTKRVKYGEKAYTRPPNTDTFMLCGSDGPKIIYNTKNNIRNIGIHNVMDGESGKLINASYVSDSQNPVFLINHYQLQSREYWEKIKMSRGDLNHWFRGAERDFQAFDDFDKLGVIDDYRLRDMNRGITNAN